VRLKKCAYQVLIISNINKIELKVFAKNIRPLPALPDVLRQIFNLVEPSIRICNLTKNNTASCSDDYGSRESKRTEIRDFGCSIRSQDAPIPQEIMIRCLMHKYKPMKFADKVSFAVSDQMDLDSEWIFQKTIYKLLRKIK
jgi:hypothetical protein